MATGAGGLIGGAEILERGLDGAGRAAKALGELFDAGDAFGERRMGGKILHGRGDIATAGDALEIGKGTLHGDGIDAAAHEHVDGGIVGTLLVGAGEVEDGEIAGETAECANVAQHHREQSLEADGADDAAGGMALDDVLHLVGEDSGELVGIVDGVDEAAKDDDVAARGGEGVDVLAWGDADVEFVGGAVESGGEPGGNLFGERVDIFAAADGTKAAGDGNAHLVFH